MSVSSIDKLIPSLSSVMNNIYQDEEKLVKELIGMGLMTGRQKQEINKLAKKLVHSVRAGRRQSGGIDEFMNEYALSSEEGVVLMCLAEALLRIPDADNADKLIADKIAGRDWEKHLGKSNSMFVNASTWGLMLTGKVVDLGNDTINDFSGYLKKIITKSGEPIIRKAMRHAMKIMGKQFVLGRTIEEALHVSSTLAAKGKRFSFDMLGEAAMTQKDADQYYASYHHAILTIGDEAGEADTAYNIYGRPSISVKLSALHPRFEAKKEERVIKELIPKLLELAKTARKVGIGLTIDAEEVNRLALTLKVFAKVCLDKEMAGWNGLGLAVQSYGRATLPVLKWLHQFAINDKLRIAVRLVKGAYWDSEIKSSQIEGMDTYPVFTRKPLTDVSYLACARYLFANNEYFYPQFATHNAHTVAAINVLANGSTDFEMQRLHGMGQALYDEIDNNKELQHAYRIYAPVGSHEDLLAYLVRRLLENGANSSFVNRLADDESPISDIIADPIEISDGFKPISNPKIPAPRDIFSPRQASRGIPLWNNYIRKELEERMKLEFDDKLIACPIVNGENIRDREKVSITSPSDNRITVGFVVEADSQLVDYAVGIAQKSQVKWDKLGGKARAEILEKAAELYEQNTAKLLSLIVKEAGKTFDNALADLREAVDFLRYYAQQARKDFEKAEVLPGPTGEKNEISLHGRGVFACISPWNFPLAIFTGQVSAALAAGNSVIAKPADQTPLIAYLAINLLYKAGIPKEVLHFLPGKGESIGAALCMDRRISGIAFTGSNEVASIINKSLASRESGIATLIAETGGMNAMIVDSTALPEQAVRDIISSAFDSCGQRCSAARILYVQEDIADKLIKMLVGAMQELTIGDPISYSTDIGPVIDNEAKIKLEEHKKYMHENSEVIYELECTSDLNYGNFIGPAAYKLKDISLLEKEVFGPILHVITYKSNELFDICDELNSKGYGLTLGIHTRIEDTAVKICNRVKVGNIYINRNQIGAVVGSQPFGGEGLSGTGPKAGGDKYLYRFATERVVSNDITASGGNVSLMSL